MCLILAIILFVVVAPPTVIAWGIFTIAFYEARNAALSDPAAPSLGGWPLIRTALVETALMVISGPLVIWEIGRAHV